MQAGEYIKALGKQITEAERHLERLRLKMEVAREVAVELDEGNQAAQPDLPPIVETPSINGGYHGLLASDAILHFLADHGVSPRKTVLDTLERQADQN